MESADYVQRVLDAYRSTPGTCGVVRKPDRAFALRLFERGVPLSAGRLEGNSLVCRYHGWAFGVDGHCTTMPETPDGSPLESVRVPAYFVLERDVLSLGD